MSDTASTDTDDGQGEQREATDPTTTTTSSSAKVVGEFSDTSGAGVQGINTASSGTPIGIEGAVPNATDVGYGLYTQHNAKVDGLAELTGITGSLTGGTELSSLTGRHLTIDGDGRLAGTGPTYETNTFTTAGESWTPISGLPGDTPVEVVVDTNGLSGGRVTLDADGSQEELLNRNGVRTRVVLPSNSVTVNSTTGWTFDQSADFGTNVDSLTGIAFKSDGSKLFACGTGQANVYSYDLLTAWDVSTASFVTSLDVSADENAPQDIAFRSDGTRLYVYGRDETVYSYKLTSAWDISSVDSQRSSVVGAGQNLAFRNDGSKLYVADSGESLIRSYDLPTSWDTSTATFSNLFLALDTLERFSGITFNSDGSRLYLAGFRTSRVFIYTVSTPWDLSTASLELTYDVSDRTTNLQGVALKDDDSRMYLPDGVEQVYSYGQGFSGSAAVTVQSE